MNYSNEAPDILKEAVKALKFSKPFSFEERELFPDAFSKSRPFNFSAFKVVRKRRGKKGKEEEFELQCFAVGYRENNSEDEARRLIEVNDRGVKARYFLLNAISLKKAIV